MPLDKRVVKQQKVDFLLLEPKRSERLEAVDDHFANFATAKKSQKGANINYDSLRKMISRIT
ncbi:hypothetical protein [Scytonema sp. NUACC21]